MSDIKDLLGKAFGEEPPLGIDRDEVFRAGRQKVRRRRRLAAGSAVAAVVIAAVGATVLTNFVETDETPPAASETHAPPGPELPVTPPSSAETQTTEAKPLTPRHAVVLTQSLFASGIVRESVVRPWPGQSGTPGFRVEAGVYLYESDVVVSGLEGKLQVTVSAAPLGSRASCEDIGEEYDSCTTVTKHDVVVAQATWKNHAGERRNVAVTVLRDGTKVAAVVTNFSRRLADEGKKPEGQQPALDVDMLTKLIVKSGFRVS